MKPTPNLGCYPKLILKLAWYTKDVVSSIVCITNNRLLTWLGDTTARSLLLGMFIPNFGPR